MQFSPCAKDVGAVCALVALSLLTHCGSAGSAAVPTAPASPGLATQALPCDVATVLAAHCQQCHSQPPQFGAPMPLVTYSDLTAPRGGARTIDLVAQRVASDTSPMPPPPNARLDSDEIGTLQAWATAGAPAAAATCGAGVVATAPTVPSLSCTPDTHLRAATSYVTTASSPLDDYECFGVDVNVAQKRHVTAIAPHIDDTRIVHHILLFQADESYSPDPMPCSAGLLLDWHLLSAWAPGTQALELPAEAGFPVASGTTHWIVQVHYNNALGLVGAEDASGFDLCTTDVLRPYDAGVVAFGGTQIDIPPLSSRTLDCQYALPTGFEGATFFDAMPHMHKLGTALSSVILPASGAATQTLVDQPSFSFSEQYLYPSHLGVHANDVVETKCTWNNSTTSEVLFGEGTGDEMCFDFAAYYPLVPDQLNSGTPIFSALTPSLGATCTLE
jgi:hypothetical protein